MMCARCVSTVRGLIPSERAVCSLLFPSAMSWTIWRWRAVSVPLAVAPRPFRPAAVPLARGAGERAVDSIAAISSVAVHDFDTQPRAPASSASAASCSESWTLKRSTSISGNAARICRVASTPFRSGIEKSRMATFGPSWRARPTASAPLRASPHTSQSARVRSRSRRPCSTTSWSSAMRMRMGVVPPAKRDGGDRGDASLSGAELEGPADDVQPLPDAADAEALLLLQGRAPFGRKRAPAPVGDFDDDALFVAAQPDGGVAAARVAVDVGEALLHHREERHLHVARHTAETPAHAQGGA